jgi:hypothetical protein
VGLQDINPDNDGGAIQIIDNVVGGNGGAAESALPGSAGGADVQLHVGQQSSSGGALTVGGSAIGGNGGNIYGSGSATPGGGAGLDFNASNASGPVTIIAGASDGGNGGSAFNALVSGANGGNGGGLGLNFYAATQGNSAVSISNTGVLQGGNGGAGFNGVQKAGTSGNGGSFGSQTYALAQGTGPVTINLTGAGGNGGGVGAVGGSVEMQADGNAYGGAINITQIGSTTAGTTCNVYGIANSLSETDPNSIVGTVQSAATSTGGFINSIAAITSTPILGLSQLAAQSFADVSNSVGTPIGNVNNSIAIATGEPLTADVNSSLQNDPSIQQSLPTSSQTMGLLSLTGEAGGTSALLTCHSEVDFNINSAAIPGNNPMLFVGLLSGTSTGDGTVQFQIMDDGVELVDQSFLSFAAADAYFGSQGLQLGQLNGGVGGGPNVTLDFLMDVTTTQAGDAFNANIIVSAVPEPSSVVLGSMAAAGLLLRRKRASV